MEKGNAFKKFQCPEIENPLNQHGGDPLLQIF